MVEGLTCFRVDISHKKKSMVVLATVDFLFYGVYCQCHCEPEAKQSNINKSISWDCFVATLLAKTVETYPPDPLPLMIGEGKGEHFIEGLAPLSQSLPAFSRSP